MTFIERYLYNLSNNVITSLGTRPLPSTMSSLGTTTTDVGDDVIDNARGNSFIETAGSLTTSVGTAVSLNADDTYYQTRREMYLTQSYIESLNEEELSNLIAKVECKSLDIKDNVKTKKL